jgi:hypothetical protein
VKVRVLYPEPVFTMLIRVASGETHCNFGGRRWFLEWSGGDKPVKLVTLQAMHDFASGADGYQRLTAHVPLGKKVVVLSELGPSRSKLTFTLQASLGDGTERLRGPRGVIIFRDQVVRLGPGVPSMVPDWRAVDEEAYANPFTKVINI